MEATEVLEPTATVEETGSTESVSEAPESATETAPVVETVSTVEEPPATRPRDAQGRFLKKDGSPVAPDEQAALAKAAASPPATPTTPATPPAPRGEPFVFRADGQKIPIPGALLSPDGALTIPPNQVPAIKQLLAEGMAHRGSWRQERAEFQRQINESSTVEKARAEKYNSAAIMLFDRIMNDDWLIALANDPVREREYLKKELGFALREADLNAPRPGTIRAPQPETQQNQQTATNDAQLEQAFESALTEEVDDLLDDPQVRALFSPEDRTDLQNAFKARAAAFAAIVEGDLKMDLHKLKAEFQREVAMQRKIKQAAVDAQKARDFNAARNKPAGGAPVVGTRGPGGAGQTSRTFKTREEYNKAMGIN